MCQFLVKDKSNYVVCLDNMFTGKRDNLDTCIGDNFELVQADIVTLDPHFFDGYKFDQIYHMACPASPPAYQKDPIQTIKVGTYGTFNILEIAAAHKARILYTSTSETYGDPLEHPQREEYRGNVNTMGPRACYD